MELGLDIDYKNARKYTRTQHYDKYLIDRKDVWHEIVVRHPSLDKHRRSVILKALFDAVEGEAFFLIDYRPGKTEQRFLIKNCSEALKRLFAKQLQIPYCAGRHLSLTVYLNVAPFRSGQKTAEKSLQEAIGKCLTQMRDGIVDLSRFAEREEFQNVEFTMNNRSVFQQICHLIFDNDEYCRQVYGFNLSNNAMARLPAIKLFDNMKLKLLDLRHNEIQSAKGLCKDLAGIKADQLYLAGNPITQMSSFPKCLQSILGNFRQLDTMQLEFMADNYNPMNGEGSIRSGHLVQSINKMDLHQYRNSEDWHAFKIVDIDQSFSKDDVFDIIFRCANPSLPPIFPCYYKFEDGMHAFLVRQCFVQLEFMVFESKVLNMTEANAITAKPFHVKIYMNAFKFKPGQIEPLQCITNALTTRCSELEGLVDLENFQNSKELQNINVDMNSSDFIKTLVMLFQKTQRYTCVTLRLGRNSITHLSVLSLLPLVGKLENLDLSYNNLPSLDAIQSMKLLQLKSLNMKGNPLCSAYGAPSTYRAEIKESFHGLQLLDNVDINSKDDTGSKQNFLSDATMYHFVDEFVRRYFETFDSNMKVILKGLYHPEALFSMHCAYSRMRGSQRLQPYTSFNSNILETGTANIIMGPDKIIEHFEKMPKVNHDMSAFTTDAITLMNSGVRITVTGCFVDEENALSGPLMMAFARTFILSPVQELVGLFGGSTRYQILNEQLNLFDPTKQQLKSFQYDAVKRSPRLTQTSAADLKVQLATLQEITGLKYLWCSTFLEKANWDLAKALKMFTVSFSTGGIPTNAYIQIA